MSLLKVKDLELLFTKPKPTPILRQLSFQLNPEESYGLVGESGCGKSLFGLSLLGLTPSASQISKGEIFFLNQSLINLEEKSWTKIRGRQIGLILQDPLTSLNPVLKIGKQLTESLCYHYGLKYKQALKKIIPLLQEVGFNDPFSLLNSYPHQLSGGMRQRILIVQAVSCEPKLIIADEPTTALDASLKIQTLELLEKLRKKQKSSLLLISHDLKLVAQFCSKIAVMYLGQIIEDGLAQDILYSPRHPYTQGLINSLPSLEEVKELTPIPGSVPEFSCLPSGCSFHPRCKYTQSICTQQEPPLLEKEQRKVRCWLYAK